MLDKPENKIVDQNPDRIHFLENENARLQALGDSYRLAMTDLEHLLDQRNTFFSNMSHEIRTPLNAIVGMADLLADTTLTSEQKECVEVIRRGSDLLLTIINDVLNLSRIESGKIALEYLELSPRILAENAFSIQAYQAWDKGIEAIVNVTPETPAVVSGDPTYITQIITNFLSNAIKFTSQGSITLSVSFETQLNDGRAVIRFAVTDTGIGITKEGIEKLFQPFHQAENSTTRKFGGTGLGLTIIKRLVSMMGGQVAVKSTPNQGSSFWVDIPFEVIHWEPPTPPIVSLADKRVLLIEPNTGARNAAVNAIAFLGGIATTVSTCDEAYGHILSGENFDLLYISTNALQEDKDGQASIAANKVLSAFSNSILFMVSLGRAKSYLHLITHSERMGFVGKPIQIESFAKETARVLGLLKETDKTTDSNKSNMDSTVASHLDILLVEDNSTNRKVMKRILEKFGLECDMAEDGSQGLDAMAKKQYDLVLMDLQMPVMGGLEATQARRAFEEQSKAKHMLIIALTADAMPQDKEKCIAAGMDDYLPKPIRPKDLLQVLEKYCGFVKPDA